MKTISKAQISNYRQKLLTLEKKAASLSQICLYDDPLIKGTPSELYKKCGKKNCKCYTNKDHRHGPYKAIQIRREKRTKLIPLKKSEYALWDLAKHYQYQISKLRELMEVHSQIESLIKEIIEKRIVEFP